MLCLYTLRCLHICHLFTHSQTDTPSNSPTLYSSLNHLYSRFHTHLPSLTLSHTDNSIELDIRVTVTATTTIIVTTTPPITPTSTSTTTSTVTTTTTTHTPRSSQVSLNVDMTLIQLVVYAPQYVELNDPRSLPQH